MDAEAIAAAVAAAKRSALKYFSWTDSITYHVRLALPRSIEIK